MILILIIYRIVVNLKKVDLLRIEKGIEKVVFFSSAARAARARSYTLLCYWGLGDNAIVSREITRRG